MAGRYFGSFGRSDFASHVNQVVWSKPSICWPGTLRWKRLLLAGYINWLGMALSTNASGWGGGGAIALSYGRKVGILCVGAILRLSSRQSAAMAGGFVTTVAFHLGGFWANHSQFSESLSIW